MSSPSAGRRKRKCWPSAGTVPCDVPRPRSTRSPEPDAVADHSDAAKSGRDLGEVVGLDRRLRVPVSGDLRAVVKATRPDVAVLCTSSSLKKVWPQLEAVLRLKLPVVSTTEELRRVERRAPERAFLQRCRVLCLRALERAALATPAGTRPMQWGDLDEIVEARSDTVVVLHPLTDHRRILPIDKTGETLEAAPGFQLVVSYNPGYQRMLKDLKPSTRQRFVALEFDVPEPERETDIVVHEGGVERADAHDLFYIGGTVKYVRQSIYDMAANTMAVDVGFVLNSDYFNGLKLAASITNFGGKMQMDGINGRIFTDIDPQNSGSNSSLPARLETGHEAYSWVNRMIFVATGAELYRGRGCENRNVPIFPAIIQLCDLLYSPPYSPGPGTRGCTRRCGWPPGWSGAAG